MALLFHRSDMRRAYVFLSRHNSSAFVLSTLNPLASSTYLRSASTSRELIVHLFKPDSEYTVRSVLVVQLESNRITGCHVAVSIV